MCIMCVCVCVCVLCVCVCVCVCVCAVYFDQLEELGKDVSYTIRFPYEIKWFTNKVTDDFTSSFVRSDRYICM